MRSEAKQFSTVPIARGQQRNQNAQRNESGRNIAVLFQEWLKMKKSGKWYEVAKRRNECVKIGQNWQMMVKIGKNG